MINQEIIRQCKTYSDLPDRIILDSPFMSKPFTSFGIIAYCLETKKWLLVRRRHSPNLIILIRGSYRKADLFRITKGLSRDEVLLIQRIINRDIPFSTVFHSTIGPSIRDAEYGEMRFMENKIRIEKLLGIGELNTEWLWPKGRLHNLSEAPFKCAIREFSEETGIHLQIPHRVFSPQSWNNSDLAYLVSNNPLVESKRGETGKTYETKCWVVVFPYHVEPPPILDIECPGEIGEVKWMSQDEAKNALLDHKYKLLEEAVNLINNYLDRNPKIAEDISDEYPDEILAELPEDADFDLPEELEEPPTDLSEWKVVRKRH